jgi:predicted GNAT family acetyltransferase
VGFFFIFPDNGYMVMKSTAVKHEARGKGISNALTYLAGMRALEKGLTKILPSLVRAGIQSESYAKKAKLLWEHRYVLMRKTL